MATRSFHKTGVSSARKLKSVVHTTMKQDGTRWYEREGRKLEIYIEAGGKCRMFIEIPDYMAAALSTFKSRDGEIEFQTNPDRLYGRDPDSILKAWDKMMDEYESVVRSSDLESRIYVQVSRKDNFDHRIPRDQQLGFQMKLQRVHYSPARTQFYSWRDDPSKLLTQIHNVEGYGSSQHEIRQLPYTDELWAQLVSAQAALLQAFDRVEQILKSEELPQLLANRALFQLSGPSE